MREYPLWRTFHKIEKIIEKTHQKEIRAWLGFRSVHVASQIQFYQDALAWHLREGGKGFLRYLMSLIFSYEESEKPIPEVGF